MNNEELLQLVKDAGHILDIKPEKIGFLNTVINLAYNSGWLDAKKEAKEDYVNK